ncbi:MAG: diacylglycerol/polyprenol kinase family protein [Candidatus Aenigmatarchaeota archaeon]|nr:SEC59/DGK1/VTE5 family protein [Nanoarchaeota archaeon]
MRQEISRQIIHISGILFVILAHVVGEIIIAYFFMASIFLLLYSEYVRLEQRRINKVIDYMESKVRGIATGMERKYVKRPFMGAFWFYMGCGITFLIFPFNIATVACIILSISDALSTLVGIKFGKHKILKNKSVEGTLAFIISGVAVTIFLIDIWIAIPAVLIGAAAEMIPDIKGLKKLKKNHILDDNYLIPILSAIVMYILFFTI